MKIIKEFFENFKSEEIDSKDFYEEYYLLKNKNNELLIKSEFFVMTIFSLGPKWAETLFEKIYGKKAEINEIVNNVRNFTGISINVEFNNNLYENAILLSKEKDIKNLKTQISDTEEINFQNVVVRVLKKKVPLDFIEKAGSSTQFLLSEDEKLEVEILQNGKVIAKGILEKLSDGYNIEITEVLY
jgi:flagellar motor switch/type III secretory pathway protein FliN